MAELAFGLSCGWGIAAAIDRRWSHVIVCALIAILCGLTIVLNVTQEGR